MRSDQWPFFRRDYSPRHRIDFNLFWERVGIVALFQRLQVAYQVGSDEAFAARCFNATSNTARLKAVCGILANADIVIRFAEDA